MKQRKGLFRVETDLLETIYQLYNTIIYRNDGGTIKLFSGGFKTNHTKNCINDLLPDGYKVYQEKFVWYLKEPNGGSRTFNDGIEIKL